MDNKLSELSKPVAEVVSKFGDPEAFGERELKVLADIQELAYGTKFYSQEYVSALLAELEAKDEALREVAFRVSAGGYNADSVDAEVFKQKIIDGINGISDVLVTRIAELEAYNARLRGWNTGLAQESCELQARLATPVRLPEPDENDYGYLSISYLQAIDAINDAGFTVEGDE